MAIQSIIPLLGKFFIKQFFTFLDSSNSMQKMKKSLKIPLYSVLVVLFSLLNQNCTRVIEIIIIDPAKDPSGFSKVLNIIGTNIKGTIPKNTACTFNINYYQSSAVTTQNASLYIPLSFTSAVPIKGVYLQVVGADNYWDIPITSQQNAGNNYIIDVYVPNNILSGNTRINIVAYGANGCTTNQITMTAQITQSVEICGLGTINGNAGLTVKRLILGDIAGKVSVNYQMYTLPDRMDIKYAGKWVATTDKTVLPDNGIPPSSVCFDGTAGYVAGGNTLTFDYDPKKGKEILIYMNGCFGQTEWNFSVSCPK